MTAARRRIGGGNAGYLSRRQYKLSIAVIFSIARRAVRTARFLSRRQCRLSIYPARHLFYRGNDGAAMPVINRGGNASYQSPPSFLSHGAPCARRGFYRGGNAGYQSIRRAIFSIAVMTAIPVINYRAAMRY